MSDEQYNFLIKYVNDYLSGYYTLCEEKKDFEEVYFINETLVQDKHGDWVYEKTTISQNYFDLTLILIIN